MNNSFSLARMLLLGVCIMACSGGREEKPKESVVVIAAEGDVDTFNPLFAQEISAGEINDLLFPALVGSDFDSRSGILTYRPMLAKWWEHRNGDLDLVFHLRTNARWSDGKPVTARDVQLSYQLYADADVASIRQASVSALRLTDGKLDVSRSVEVKDDSTVVFHFEMVYPGQLFDAGLPILPSHIFESLPRNDLRTHAVNRNPISAGPFVLAKWVPLQEIVLASNGQSTLPYPARISRLIFRVLPDHRSRVSQLLSGEVDVVSGLRKEDADRIAKEAPSVRIISIPGRDYDFLGWNNIDPKMYEQSRGARVRPHRLFGAAGVRRALTMAINRREIVEAYLGEHGQEAFGGVSPLFKWAYNDSLQPLPFDRQQALVLLAKEGWNDTDGDGILDKQGTRFSFTLKVPSGNQLRSVVAAVVQQHLKEVKIDMKVEQVERGTFWDDVLARRYDAWLAGFSVPLQMQLDDLWGSDLERYPYNVTGFRNNRVDEILAAAKALTDEADGAALWREFQTIVHTGQPCTFLYWINNIVGVSERVEGTSIGVLGTTHKAWEWSVRKNMERKAVALKTE